MRLKGWTRRLVPDARALDEVYGMNRRNIDLVYKHNERRDYPLADNKWLCKQHLNKNGIPTPDLLAACRGLFEVETTLEKVIDRGHFVLKPASGSGGGGILVVHEKTGDSWNGGAKKITPDDLRTHFANLVFGAYTNALEDTALVEEKVVPHELFADLWSEGVCDLRIITLRSVPVLAMLRVPTRRSAGKANLHQGGIGVAIDLPTGRTSRARTRQSDICAHPETGKNLIDLAIPQFDQCLEIARATAASVPLGYLGVDLVIDANRGPLVLEINARPGLEIQNVHHKPLGRALMEAAES